MRNLRRYLRDHTPCVIVTLALSILIGYAVGNPEALDTLDRLLDILFGDS